jgi:Glycosyltransferase family 87
VIGQAQVLLTLFTAIGAPWSIALATNIKLFPAAIALWWIGRRDWRNLGLFAGTLAGLALFQLVLAPQASLDYLTAISLKQVGAIRNISPYAISPLLWGALVIAGVAVVLRLAPTRWGWPAAVVLSVVGTPRLLVYMFMTFIAVLSEPRGHRRR